MNRPLRTAVLAAGLASSAVANDLQERVNAEFCLNRSEILRLDLPDTVETPFTLDVQIAGLPYIIDLAPRSLRAPDHRVLAQQDDGSWLEVDPGPVRTYAGDLVGDEGAWVRASLHDDGLWARIHTSSGEDYWIEPLVGRVRGATFEDHVLYNGVDSNCGGGWCGADLIPDNDQKPFIPGDEVGPADESIWIAEMAIDCDFPFHNQYGGVSGAQNRVTSVINAMNGQYENDVTITNQITTILVRSSSSQDPYTTTDPGGLLSQFRGEWNSNQAGIPRDYATLFTGRNLDGSVIGIAYLGVICTSSGYNVCQNLSSFSCATDLSAHECGHNWNADHCSCSGFTMNPSLTCANNFNKTETTPDIFNHRNSRNCLDLDLGGTVIFRDRFNDGDLLDDGWTRKNFKANARKAADFEGTHGVKTLYQSWAARAVSTVGFSTIRLEFAHRVLQYEGSEGLIVQWSGDGGSTWNTIATLTASTWKEKSYVLPSGAGNNANFAVRFLGGGVGKNSTNGKKKKYHIDDVRILGE